MKTQKFNTMELVQLDEEIEEVINTESHQQTKDGMIAECIEKKEIENEVLDDLKQLQISTN